MNPYFLAAAVLMILTGLVHTVFGERIIFRHMRAAGVIPTNGMPVLREYQLRIVWATWHLVTVMGILIAGILAWLALPAQANFAGSIVVAGILVTTLASSALVAFATRGRHLGWASFLVTACLIVAGMHS